MAALLDQFGREVKPGQAKPEARAYYAPEKRDRQYEGVAAGLAPQKLATCLREAEDGDLFSQACLFEEIEERDGHIQAVLSQRKLAVLNYDWDVEPADPDDKKSVEIAEFAHEALERFAGLEDAKLDLLDAVGKGYSVCEVDWTVADGVGIRAIRHVHPKKFVIGDDGDFRLLTETEQSAGIRLAPNKFIVHAYHGRSGYPERAGVLRPVTWMYLFKRFGFRDWLIFAEAYGMPLRIGIFEATTTAENRQVLESACAQIGSDAWAVISSDTKIEFKEAQRTSTAALFREIIEVCNTEISKAILGQTLTTEVGGKGSYAASKTHQEVREDLIRADAQSLDATITRDLITPLVRFQFGPDAPIPSHKTEIKEPEDLSAEADRFQKITTFLPVGVEFLYEKFGIPKPEPGEETVGGRQAAAPAGFEESDESEEKERKDRAFLATEHTEYTKGEGNKPEAAPNKALLSAGRRVAAASSATAKVERYSWRERLFRLEEYAGNEYANVMRAFGPIWQGRIETLIGAETDVKEALSVLQKYEIRRDANLIAEPLALIMQIGALAGILDQRLNPRSQDAAALNQDPLDWFDLPPEEAIAWFQAKNVLPYDDFVKLGDILRAKAFSYADAQDVRVIAGVKDALQKQIETGGTLADFRNELDDVFEKLGVNPAAQFQTPRQIELVFNQNVNGAYAAGRWKEMKSARSTRPYLLYRARMSNTRPAHAAMNNRVFPADSAVWDEWYPPNGFNCHCWVESLSKRELDSEGRKVSGSPEDYTVDGRGNQIPLTPDKGFATNPAMELGL